jgi:hypothetical protein
MSRPLMSLLAVCAFAVAAQATVITHQVTLLGDYAVTGGSVAVYKVSFDAGVDRKIGSLVLDVGSYASPDPCSPDPNFKDPYQVWYKYRGGFPVHNIDVMTPTIDDITGFGSPYEETDTHFILGGISGWTPVVVLPGESNNGSLANPPYNPGGIKEGFGYLTVAIAVPVAYRTRTMDVIQVGVFHASPLDKVYCKSGSANDLGDVTHETFLVPEPAALTMLGLGALCLIRRRR